MFLGVPIEIMPEEAQLLVERGIAIIVDDARAHDQAVRSADEARRADYMARIEKKSRLAKQAKDQDKAVSRKLGLEKQSKRLADSTRSSQAGSTADLLNVDNEEPPQEDEVTIPEDAASIPPDESPIQTLPLTATANAYRVTPATSRLLLPPNSVSTSTVKDLPSSYPLYRHLHDQGFFMTPGLRFGCQYTVYPGDPLRFHSHFLAVGTEWDEEIDLMEIVGGGRLGTGVKKGFLLGGAAACRRCEILQRRVGSDVSCSCAVRRY